MKRAHDDTYVLIAMMVVHAGQLHQFAWERWAVVGGSGVKGTLESSSVQT